jgi:hypothetical protein
LVEIIHHSSDGSAHFLVVDHLITLSIRLGRLGRLSGLPDHNCLQFNHRNGRNRPTGKPANLLHRNVPMLFRRSGFTFGAHGFKGID